MVLYWLRWLYADKDVCTECMPVRMVMLAEMVIYLRGWLLAGGLVFCWREQLYAVGDGWMLDRFCASCRG
jgi:hypothetical protein